MLRFPDIHSDPALLLLDSAAVPTATTSTVAAATSSTSASKVNVTRTVFVHPLAVLQILDHHGRRHQEIDHTAGKNGSTAPAITINKDSMNNQNRVIGTLLGRIDGNTVEVTNCFAVPHAERGSDEVAIGKDFNRKMLALHMRSSKDIVVGWYASTANECFIADTSSLIHEFYAGECEDNDPIHLVVDTRLLDDCMQIKAYQSAPLLVNGEHLGNTFHELQLSLHSNEAETICLREMIKSCCHINEGSTEGPSPTTNEEASVAGLQVSVEKLYQLLDSTLQYVNSVVDGTIPMDAEKGRQISDTLASVPMVRPEVFDKLFHNSMQDLLTVSYLSNVTRTQTEIAQKLNATLG
jgi:translation initiation factor 3 subunit F